MDRHLINEFNEKKQKSTERERFTRRFPSALVVMCTQSTHVISHDACIILTSSNSKEGAFIFGVTYFAFFFSSLHVKCVNYPSYLIFYAFLEQLSSFTLLFHYASRCSLFIINSGGCFIRNKLEGKLTREREKRLG